MRKLLSANAFRLRRSRVFWVVAGAMFAWGAFTYFMLGENFRYLKENSNSFNVYFFNGNLCVGLALAVFIAFFIGQQHMEGGLRSMLTVGHRRASIYLVNLLTCGAAGIGFLLAFWLGGSLVGLPGVGPMIFKRISHPLQGIVWSYMAAFGYSALFCLVAMLDGSKARTVVVCLLLAALLLMGSLFVQNGLEEPEFTERFVSEDLENFTKEENIPNPHYPRGAIRRAFEILDALLPSCQALRPVLEDAGYSVTQALFSAGWIAVLTAFGLGLFRKKDIP